MFETKEEKAVRLVNEGKVKRYSHRGFVVEGSVAHDVFFGPKGASCTCTWSTYHENSKCSHILACEKIIASDKFEIQQ